MMKCTHKNLERMTECPNNAIIGMDLCIEHYHAHPKTPTIKPIDSVPGAREAVDKLQKPE